ncbi:hypothetical protein KSP39_PZI012035 [Platanthera zijinensis]|uniref:ACT domain-containing protein ACR n=1 Tax=Platanthera zijinensis TaxID=2320716 RepID=A0AAP0G4V0_9ASPA
MEMVIDPRSGCHYIDPEFDPVSDGFPPPRVSIDTVTCEDRTIVKVDGVNRPGVLLEVVQVLTDLDLIVRKAYVASDGEWLMDVFHVTDQLGHKLTDTALVDYIQESLALKIKGGSQRPAEVKTCLGNLLGAGHLPSDSTALEITAADRPGLLSDVTAVLTGLSCEAESCRAWTHNGRAACVIYITDSTTRLPITEPNRLAVIEEKMESVVEARHNPGELRRVSLSGPVERRDHMDRRLHQLMQDDKDYEAGPPPPPVESDQLSVAVEARRWSGGECREGGRSEAQCGPRVSIDCWKERDYYVVNVRSRDRPKLMFDTIWALTEFDFDVAHAYVSTGGSIAVQEYYVRRIDGTPETEMEQGRFIRCVLAAVERRVAHGLRVEIHAPRRDGLISDVTKSFRENGMSLAGAEWVRQQASVVGSFYVTEASSSSGGPGRVDPRRLEVVRDEIGDGIFFETNDDCSGDGGSHLGCRSPSSVNSSSGIWSTLKEKKCRPKLWLGSLLWSRIGQFSGNSGSIQS